MTISLVLQNPYSFGYHLVVIVVAFSRVYDSSRHFYLNKKQNIIYEYLSELNYK